MKNVYTFALFFGLSVNSLSGQQSMGIGTDFPDPQSILDIQSTDQGIFIPRMTTIQRNAIGPSAADFGLLIYNTDTNSFNYWDGAIWQSFPSGVLTEWTDAGTFLHPADGATEDVNVGSIAAGPARLNVDSDKNRGIGINLAANLAGTVFGLHNVVTNSGAGNVTGNYTELQGLTNVIYTAQHNLLNAGGTGAKYGTYNEITGTTGSALYGTYNDLNNTSASSKYGTYNAMRSNDASTHYGVLNRLSMGTGTNIGIYNQFPATLNSALPAYGMNSDFNNIGTGGGYGTFATFSGLSTGSHIGHRVDFFGDASSYTIAMEATHGGIGNGPNSTIESVFTNTGSGEKKGAWFRFVSNDSGIRHGLFVEDAGTGNAIHYGVRTMMTSAGTGPHYGIYSSAIGINKFAGYFLGDVAIGTIPGDIYILPPSRGLNNQIMQTDGAGNVSWVNPAAGSDNDWTVIGNYLYPFNLNYAVGVGTATPGMAFQVVDDAAAGIASFNLTNALAGTTALTNSLQGSVAGLYTGLLNNLNLSGTGEKTGIQNQLAAGANGVTGNTYGIRQTIDFDGSGSAYGIQTNITGSSIPGNNIRGLENNITGGAGEIAAIRNTITPASNSDHFGVFNIVSAGGDGSRTGIYNEAIGSGDGEMRGVYNYTGTTGLGIVSGVYNDIPVSGDGDHFGENTVMYGDGIGTRIGNYVFMSGNTPLGSGGHYGAFHDLGAGGNGERYGVYNLILGSSNGNGVGIINFIDGTAGAQYGTYSSLTGTTPELRYGSHVTISGIPSGFLSNSHYGAFHYIDTEGLGTRYGVRNEIAGLSTGEVLGLSNSLTSATDARIVGSENLLATNGNGSQYGIYSALSGSGTGSHYGTYHDFSGTGSGAQYGQYTRFLVGGGNIHYGSYHEFDFADSPITQYGTRNFMGGITVQKYGTYTEFPAGGVNSGMMYGHANYFNSNDVVNTKRGYYNFIGTNDGGDIYGLQNVINSFGGGSTIIAGTHTVINTPFANPLITGNWVSITNGGTGLKYGNYVNITSNPGNTYGIYSDVNSLGPFAWAAYLVGQSFVSYRLGIGTNAPAYQLHLTLNEGAKPTSNTWTVISDERLKKDVRNYESGLDILEKMRPVWFTYTGEAGMPDDTGVGLIAQELQNIAPYMVREWEYRDSTSQKPETYLAIDYGAMDFILINAVKELHAMLGQKDAEILELTQRLEDLEKSLEVGRD
jgi:hypothetical protein